MYCYAMVRPDGRITQIMTAPYWLLACDATISDDTHYADMATGAIYPKRMAEVAQSVDGLTVTLSGLPAGMTVSSNGMSTMTDDDPLVIDYDLPGTYAVELSGHVEYQDTTVEVTVGQT